MRVFVLFLLAASLLACSSTEGIEQDVGTVRLVESNEGLTECTYRGRITAGADIRSMEGDRAEAMELAFDRLRNAALKKGCDTVYLMKVEETTTHIEMMAEGYLCNPTEITHGPVGGSLP